MTSEAFVAEENGSVELMQRQKILFYSVDADVMGFTLITEHKYKNAEVPLGRRRGEKKRGQSFPIGVSSTRCQAAAPVGRQRQRGANH